MRRSAAAAAVLLVALVALLAVVASSAAPLTRILHEDAPFEADDVELTAGSFLYPRSPHTFPSASVEHLEPVLNFRVWHEDNQHLHTEENLHPATEHPLKNNAANSLAAHSLVMRERHGHKQPFPTSISISFRAYDRDWHLQHLELDTGIWGEETHAEVMGEDGKITKHQHSLNTYRSAFSSEGTGSEGDLEEMDGWAVVTLAEDGLITATLYTPEEIYQIDPIHVHMPDLDEEHPSYDLLLEATPHNLLMHKHSQAHALKPDPVTGMRPATCGVAKRPLDADGKPMTSGVVVEHEESVASPPQVEVTDPVSGSRKLLYKPGAKVTRWANCWPGDTSRIKISLGVAADVGYYQKFGNTQNVLNAIATVYGSVSAVYMAMSALVANPGPATPFCIAPYGPVCGNGVVEQGEQCDVIYTQNEGRARTLRVTSRCCKQCRFKVQCTPGRGNVCCNPTSCRFYASTKVCDNKQGYCSNGVCKPSICPGYSLKFCGMVNGGCKQSCKQGRKACSVRWTRPNLNVAHGTVCKAAPDLRTCASGKCKDVSPFSTYVWADAGSEPCNCYGTQRALSDCVDQDGTKVDDALCDPDEKPDLTLQCTPPPTCYAFQAGDWSACDVNCGFGKQTRTVTCVQGPDHFNAGAQVSMAQCAGLPQIPSSQVCPTTGAVACPLSWVAGNWTHCSQGCGGGQQARTVQCMQMQNNQLSEVNVQFCNDAASGLGAPPATTQSCNNDACVDPRWSYSLWGLCSGECKPAGGAAPTHIRKVECANAAGTAYPDEVPCASLPPHEPLVQECNTLPCSRYEWATGEFGACSASCGGGVQTRTATCFDSGRDPNHLTPVSSQLCTLTQPMTLAACNVQACQPPPLYVWLASAWTKCSVPCGGGTSTRMVKCVDSNADDAVQTDETKCTATKPEAVEPCGEQACDSYEWQASGFSACSVGCGGGIQTQSVDCVEVHTRSVVSALKCASAGAKPLSSTQCNSAACPAVMWKSGPGSPCSVACGGGVSTYTPKCYSVSTGAELSESACAGIPQPASTVACNTAPCPTVWVAGLWDECSSKCGPVGTQRRTIKCFNANDNPATATPLALSACSGSKPADSTRCFPPACPKWQPLAWGNCSTPCGAGLQQRALQCVDAQSVVVEDAKCYSALVPPVQRACQVQPCPHWHRQDWTPCSKPCTDGFGSGTQTREVHCRYPHDDPQLYGLMLQSEELCLLSGDSGDGVGTPVGIIANGKPATSQQCGLDACISHYWSAQSRSQCSKSCAGGQRTVTWVCMNSATGQTASESLCVGAKPMATEDCNTHACPALSWQTGQWSNCSTFCGTGMQTRDVSCRNAVPPPDIHYAFVNVDPSECVAAGLGAAPVSEQVCSAPAAICWGSGYAVNGLKNGRCNVNGTACECRSGLKSPRCDAPTGISSVTTDAALFEDSGVPLGQPLVIEWRTSVGAQLPYVSVLLVRTGDASSQWPVAQHLADKINNTGSWTWQVGSMLAEDDNVVGGLEEGSGYAIRIWGSAAAGEQATSLPFAISEPCAYVSCGAHGSCSLGKCICNPGWTGARCTSGPCETAQCDPETSSCNNIAVIASGQYLSDNVCAMSATTQTCLQGYTGERCATPPECASINKCQHGGDLKNVVIMNGTDLSLGDPCSGECSCTNSWTGASCETCGLQCANGGVANADCTKCEQCPTGFFGNLCECKQYNLGFRFLYDAAWATAIDDEASLARQRWNRTLSHDVLNALASVTGVTGAARVLSITKIDAAGETPAKVDVQVRFSLECSNTELFAGGEGDMSMMGVDDDDEEGSTFGDVLRHAEAAPAGAEESDEEPSSTRRRLLQDDPLNPQPENPVDPDAPNTDSTGPDMPDPPNPAGQTTEGSTANVKPMSTPEALNSAYKALLPVLSDLDSALFQGVLTSKLDTSVAVTAYDPSGQHALASPQMPKDCYNTVCVVPLDPPASDKSSKGGLGMGAIIAIAVVIAVLVLVAVIVAVVVIRRRGQAPKATSAPHRSAASPAAGQPRSENEMVSNPAVRHENFSSIAPLSNAPRSDA